MLGDDGDARRRLSREKATAAQRALGGVQRRIRSQMLPNAKMLARSSPRFIFKDLDAIDCEQGGKSRH
jgi:hypothetical protein